MDGEISVCHVVNLIRDSSIPGEIATAQAVLDGIDRVGVLAWYDVEPFRGDDRVETGTLDVPRDTYRIDREQYRRLRSELSGYDLVHTHHNHSGFYGKLVAKRLGLPVVTTEHNDHEGFTRMGRIANGVTNVVADSVVCVSASVRESFAHWEGAIVPDRKVSVIHNGVDRDRVEAARNLDWSIHDVLDIDPNAVVVGSAGMLVEQKAPDVLVEAVDRANAKSDRPIELVVSGDGGMRESLERRIDRAEYGDRLHLLGYLERRDQVYRMMDEVDLYAMPSRWEGFCVAVLEAMALGNPCVVSDIPVFREVYGDAALYHPVDDVRALSERILELASDTDLRAEYANRGANLANERTLRRTAAEYGSLYRNLAPGSGSSAGHDR